ncbi:MAG TPA: hypothetical protein VKR06_41090 [Ktedonosporobacter sp.]|nr:hypothetical protein [Ktedonosporobacter sp.]
MQTHKYHPYNAFRGKWYLLCLILLLAACAGGPTTTASPSPQKTTSGQVTPTPPLSSIPETCQPTALTTNTTTSIPEAQGKATNAELWALFFADPQSIHTGQEIKIVWRMTGSGDFQIVARHAGNIQVKPIWGPDAHGGSSWNRPGSEWGTGFNFPSPGCWDLHTTRGAASGDLWIMVK